MSPRIHTEEDFDHELQTGTRSRSGNAQEEAVFQTSRTTLTGAGSAETEFEHEAY